ncbi:Squalene--hopene cyclase [Planctomycetales bacterium 10988]|nr:Squalene--hopene cyclase [Planctomycetales bacterium 10988]
MFDFLQFDQFLDFFTPARITWSVLLSLTILLLLLTRTRWGHSKPLRKCAFASLIVHLVIAGYFATVPLTLTPGDAREEVIQVSHFETFEAESLDSPLPEKTPAPEETPAEELPQQTIPEPEPEPTPEPEPEPEPEPKPEEVPLSESSPELFQETKPSPKIEPKPEKPLLSERPNEPLTPRETPLTRPEVPLRRKPTTPETPVSSEVTATPSQPTLSRRPPELPPTREPLGPPDISGMESSNPEAPKTNPKELEQSELVKPIEVVETSEEASDPAPQSEWVRGELPSPTRMPSRPPSSEGLTPSRPVSNPLPPPISRPGFEPRPPSLPTPSRSELTTVDPLPAPEIGTDRPEIYRGRTAPNRQELVEQQGGSSETEAAVQAALEWLAMHQEIDGNWSARRFQGGREWRVGGQNREGAGAKADAGVTGLALLAFLGAGFTHQEGKYKETVQRGLRYLIEIQKTDGSLGGDANLYAAMYCHAMASFAMSECFAITQDPDLEMPVRRAIGYTLSSQNLTDGSWRYQPGDTGDTSLLGWQLMALKSAHLAGIAMPQNSREGMIRYLGRAAKGRFGGLAAYRPGEEASVTMSAEAHLCKHFLNIPPQTQATEELSNYLLQSLPHLSNPDYYYWYYGTLAAHQLPDPIWQKWNKALVGVLVSQQRTDGTLKGSWDPNSRWGGYGGRVYSTAMGALCLEVYYRFLPVYE